MTVLRADRVVDPFSGEPGDALDWDTVTETTVPELCAVYASVVTESHELGDIATPIMVVSTLTVMLPYGFDVRESDMLRVETGPYAQRYDVKAVKQWKNPFTGWAPGTEVRIQHGDVDG